MTPHRIARSLSTIRLRLRSLFLRKRAELELDEELRFHVEREIESAVAGGLTAEEGRRRALTAIGGIEQRKEECRDMRRVNIVENVLHDLRYGGRMILRSPGFAAVAVLSLALGIGANMTVFTFIHAVFLRTLPLPHPQQLVQVTSQGKGLLSFPMYRDIRDRQQALTGIFASSGDAAVRLTIRDKGGALVDLDNMRVAAVTWNYFDVLDVRPAIGRAFTPEDDRIPDSASTAGTVIVLSDDFWERHFGRDPDVLNRTIQLGVINCRVIGVMPPGFTGDVLGRAPAGWTPLIPLFTSDDLENRRGTFTTEVARLKPDVTIEQAQSSMTALFQQLLKAEGVVDKFDEGRIVLVPAGTGVDAGLRRTYSKPLWIIMAIVGVVLLIACANIANLLLARSNSRRSEIGVRLAIGCSRARLVAQLLTESLLLSALGAVAALGVANAGTRALLRLVDSTGVIQLDLHPDAAVLTFLAAIAVLTGVGFGLVPSLRTTRLDVSPALKTASRGQSNSASGQKLNRGLMAFQVALSLVLLIASGLLIRSFRNLHEIDPGFRPENVVVFDIVYSPSGAGRSQVEIVHDIYERVRKLDGVESASMSGILIFSPSDIGAPVSIAGYSPASGERVIPRYNSVTAGYFETVGMTLLDGRTFQQGEGFDTPPVAVINESMARRYFEGHAVGRTMTINAGPNRNKPIEIVGVVRDAKYNNLRESAKPMFYVPFGQLPRSPRSIEVRTRQPLAGLTASVRQIISEASRDVMIRRVLTLSEQVDQSLAAERLMMRLSSFFGGLALLLACIGLYGVVSYAVSQRTNEIGIRMTLGATKSSVIWMVLRENMLLVASGIAFGIVISVATTRLLSTFLFGLTPTDVVTTVLAIVVLLVAALAAAYLPARRASNVDPMIALRYE